MDELKRIGAWTLGLLFLSCACQEESGSGTDSRPPSVKVHGATRIDKSSHRGRVFMYLDAGGTMVKTKNYEEIPVDRRGGVMVLEGRKRSRARRVANGSYKLEELPPLVPINGAAQDGARDAAALLKANPPTPDPDPDLNDEQWRAEIKRELEELHREEARHEQDSDGTK